MRPKIIIYRQYPTIRMQIRSLIYYLRTSSLVVKNSHPSYASAQVELESYDECWFRSWLVNYQSFYDIPDATSLTNSSCRWRFILVSFELLTHNDSLTFR